MFNYENIKPYIFKLDPEYAHTLAEWILRTSGAIPALLEPVAKRACVLDSRLIQEIEGLHFYNPVGMGAGFDKNATMIRALSALGFSHLELGTVTPKPQSGNPKPRLFRHASEESIQNAMGFNNEGAEAIFRRLRALHPYAIPLGVNIGKNRTTSEEDALQDYESLLRDMGDVADYIAINLSSPNTPGLRNLQNEGFVGELFKRAKKITKTPIFLKISPDLEINEAQKLCSKAIKSGAKGIIATNTTIDYSLLNNPQDTGGISGKVLTEKSYALFKELGRAFFGKTTLISVGGISNAQEAYRRIKAGASLVQIYTALIYKGPLICKNINQGILECLEKDGYAHISEAIGADVR